MVKEKVSGFLDFIREQGVMGLAIGFLLGGAVSKVVSSFVNDIVNPIIGLILGTTNNLKDYSFFIGGSKIAWGNFTANVIDFIIIAVVVYFGFKGLGLDRLDKKK